MTMVYCRGCGKEIHETAPTCPHCGALQKISRSSSDLIPDGIKGWSWGAFLFNWIWAIGNRTWIGLFALIPYVGFIMAIILGIKGREWAWKNKQWDSVEHFNRVQRKWSVWAGVLIGGVMGLGIIAAISIPAYQDYVTKAKAAKTTQQQQQPIVQNEPVTFQTNGYTDEQLVEISTEINKSVPKMIDAETRFDSTTTYSNTLVYNYTIVNIGSSGVSEQLLKETLGNKVINGVCANKDLVDSFLNMGVTLIYRYLGNEGGLIGEIVVSPEQCESLAKGVSL